jgi:hypothetical protein
MRSTILRHSGWLLLALAAPALAQSKALSPGKQGSASAMSEQCHRAAFEDRARGGEAYSRPLGGGLVFHLQPEGKNQGWQIVVSPEGSQQDWAYPVNPPLRSANAQAMMTGWGEGVRARLGHPHRVRFLLEKADYERMSQRVSDALWPYSAKDPEHATEAYFDELARVRTGTVEVTAIDYDRSGPPKSVEWMRFLAVVTVPGDFAADPRLNWRAGACAPPEQR